MHHSLPRSSTLTSLASDRAPSLPKMCSVCPQFGHWYKLMFCTMPSTGTFTLRNISVPLRASSSAMSCGVVTITAPTVSTYFYRLTNHISRGKSFGYIHTYVISFQKMGTMSLPSGVWWWSEKGRVPVDVYHWSTIGRASSLKMW